MLTEVSSKRWWDNHFWDERSCSAITPLPHFSAIGFFFRERLGFGHPLGAFINFSVASTFCMHMNCCTCGSVHKSI